MSQYSLNQTNLFYDPYRQGFDNNQWKILWGNTPVLNAYRIEIPNGGAICHFSDILKGDFYFNINFSVAPASGGAVTTHFGLFSPSTGAFIGFRGKPDELTAAVVNDDGDESETDAITWNSDWTNTNTAFRIIWEAGLVKFKINGTTVDQLSSQYIPHGPLCLYFYDDSSDATGLGTINVRGSQCIFTHLIPNSTAAPEQSVFRIFAHDDITVTDVITTDTVGVSPSSSISPSSSTSPSASESASVSPSSSRSPSSSESASISPSSSRSPSASESASISPSSSESASISPSSSTSPSSSASPSA